MGSRTSARKNSSPVSKRKRKKPGFWRVVAALFAAILISSLLFLSWFFFTASGTSFRYKLADALITTQHRFLAKYLIGEQGLADRVADYAKQFQEMGEELDTHQITLPTGAGDHAAESLTSVEEVDGKGYHGFLMTVKDPTKIRLVVPEKAGRGEKVGSMVKRTGAIAGVNAGGFADPEWQGNGFQPIGLVITQGEIYYNGLGKDASAQIVGLDKQGKMLAGRYSIKELMKLGISEAVSFEPRMIVNGKGLIKNHADGWGVAPRTVMGQKEDGSILFLVIDGRQIGYSIGADLYDCQQIMLEHGAVIAANLDGGSSSVLIKEGGDLINKPSSKSEGGRYLPTAFLVFDDPSAVNVPNVWAGLNPGDIDPSKW
ncbi:phosphodiester glycosidase family protein [Paenibacillus sp. Leaf72]|uniref:phosphodiester glycosidase family protein n=1 Tax=Paenibacillus sp. Leaf72 TaxID=1736234 RepID=UPI0006FCAC26|nr:phosphodiester glycosidase family protein [Paenibacillus sp. Leaf72]KQO18838.1 exopolysaccharide biosynthesis protein [Paenibacillus sp. Leaf72]